MTTTVTNDSTDSSSGHHQRPTDDAAGLLRVALLGNPNTGKTTLFNRISGLRAKTSNFPGTTQEARIGHAALPGAAGSARLELVDLPGIYSLELDLSESEVCRRVLAGTLGTPGLQRQAAPDAVLVVVDATNLGRNLMLAGEVLRRRLPTVVALNMVDLARQRGLHIDPDALAQRLGCEVIPTCARSGDGVPDLLAALSRARVPNTTPPGTIDGLEAWADEAYAAVASAAPGSGATPGAPAVFLERHTSLTDRLDRIFTHPVGGVISFMAVMFAVFYALFSIAAIPMDLIELVFAHLGTAIESVVPPGILQEFLVGGVVGAISGTVVFLPQICLLFFIISLLEDTGYLARAAFVMDRALRPFGLSGHAFVPLLSSHACALPGIMACRAIPEKKDRLATILVAPFMSCSARIPVYVLLTVLLFPESPFLQSVAFMACYLLGILAGLFSALVARRTILRGKGRPMMLELPTYKRPSLRTALYAAYDRGLIFLKKAGTVILAICILLWWLSTYPHVAPPQEAANLAEQGQALVERGDADGGEQLIAKADELTARHALEHSFAGRIGRAVQPVFAPLGYDWQLSIAVMTSFAAREVFAGSMATIVAGTDDPEGEGVLQRIAEARRDDGVTLVFLPAVCWSLLVYYVLAMQCLPTLAVTAKEAGGARWAFLQLGWMSGLAYLAALIVYQTLTATGMA
jgi:ferrous iron transport protein B